MDLTAEEKRLIAYTLLGEDAGNKSGMEAVMSVILNRANSGKFPSNPAAVATQKNSKGVHQFSAWNTTALQGNNPTARFSTTSAKYKEALSVVEAGLAGKIADPTGGALYYVTQGSTQPPFWSKLPDNGKLDIGGLTFAKGKPGTALDAVNALAGADPVLDALPYSPADAQALKTATLSWSSQAAPDYNATPTLGFKDGQPDAATSHPSTNPEVVTKSVQEVARQVATQVGGRASISDADLFSLLEPQIAHESGLISHSVTTVPIDPATNAPIVAKPAADPIGDGLGSYKQFQFDLGMGSGAIKTSGGIAGTVQLPHDVTPKHTDFGSDYGTLDSTMTPMEPSDAGYGFAPAKFTDKLVTTQQQQLSPEYVAWKKSMDAYTAAANNPGYIPYTGYGDPNHLTGVPAPVNPGVAPPKYITVTKHVTIRSPINTTPAPVQQFVTLKSGNRVPIGTIGTAQGGKFQYVVQADGSVLNKTTGIITGKAPGAPLGAKAAYDKAEAAFYAGVPKAL